MPTNLRVRLVTGASLPDGDAETRFLAEHLAAAGWTVDVAIWSDPEVDWSEAPITVIRSTWDYPDRLDDFLAWTRAAAEHTRLHNPPDLVLRNIDKRYLLALAEAGVATVPSRWVESTEPGPIRDAMTDEGWREVVMKPCVGVDGVGVVRIAAGSPIPQLPACSAGWLIQPYLPAVTTAGERSVLLFGGELSHTVSKRPGPDEFRVQERWGGRTDATPNDPTVAGLAREALTAFVGPNASPPLYARIDLLPDDGEWLVTEIELIEPSFYLDDRPERAAAFERALQGEASPARSRS
ncbi:ATP-grasp domain-containing protein [Gaopeijia maritima]|uniref:ATP-grasp domain-containing protein n=1 Tax=Gaopeijia maritima TaxID=3119007 RepID=A0ABU9EBC9_9BACT